MKQFIKKLLREEIIDGQNMSSATQTICNKMTIDTYAEGLALIKQSLSTLDKQTRKSVIEKIRGPLSAWKKEQNEIDKEKNNDGMSGDSMKDESNTYWVQIQSTLCELGSNFQ